MTIEFPLIFVAGMLAVGIIAVVLVKNRKHLHKDNSGKPGSAIGL